MIGNKIKELRKQHNLTQEQLALIVGVERSSIGKYEGKQQIVPSDDVKIRLAEYFGVSVDYLLGREESEIKATATDTDDGLKTEVMELLESLPEDRREQALSYIRFLATGSGTR